MRGMNRLADVTERLMQKVDSEADKAAQEVEAAGNYALDAVDKFKGQAADMRRMADDVLARLGQTSNMPPPTTEAGIGKTADSLPKAAIAPAASEPIPEV